MIASRFRSVGWVGVVTGAALGCYLVSQRVASERAGVEALDQRIVAARVDIRKLETELTTRSRMPVLESWNSEVLALSAPSANQYLHGEIQLASFEPGSVAPRVVAVASRSEAGRPSTVVPTQVAATDEPAAEPMLRHANYVRPSDGGFEAPRRVALLDENVVAELKQTARRERSSTEVR